MCGRRRPPERKMYMRSTKERVFSLLLALVLIVGLLPVGVWAGGTEGDTVTIEVRFDFRSVGEPDALEGIVAYPSDQRVTVPSGSSLYEVIEAAKNQGGFSVTYGQGFDGSENGYVIGFGDIGEIEPLCDAFGASYTDLFQYAGWTYTGDPVGGMGIQSDKVTQDGTVTFTYRVYTAYDSDWTEHNYDGPFVEAYYGLKEDLAAAEQLQEESFPGDWATLQEAIAQGTQALSEVEADDESGGLGAGLVLPYLCQKGSAIWGGDGSPTGKLEKARLVLDQAMRGEVAPASIELAENNVELEVGKRYTLRAAVLPEGASQEVTYDVLLGEDCFTIDEAGVILPTKENSLCMIQVKSQKDPSVMANFMFKIVAAAPVQADPEALLSNISASYTSNSSEWNVMDMGAYALLRPEGAKLNGQTRQAYIDQTILALADEPSIGTCAKGVLILASQGVDPTALTLVDGTAINAVEKLKACTWDPKDSFFVYTAPYVLLAYQQGNWDTQEQEQALVDYLLSLQKEDGSWDTSWGYDTMGMVFQGLAAYYGKQEAVTSALDRGVEYLRTAIGEDGLYPNSYDVALSSAEVAIGLSAIGVDPAQVKNGTTGMSLKEGILSKANEDNTAFTYNGSDNPGTTERCFLALIAMAGGEEKQSAYSVYDFTSIPKEGAQMSWTACPVEFTLVPGQATVTVTGSSGEIAAKSGTLYDLEAGDYTYTASCEGYTTKSASFTVTAEEAASHQRKTISVSLTSQGGQGGGSGTKEIDVTVKVMVPPEDTSRIYTYKNDRSEYTNLLDDVSMPLTVESGSTVRDVLIEALDQQGLDYEEKSDGYFVSIDGWEEMGRGSSSGWLYMVGSTVPEQSADDYQLTSDKQVTWFYTDDYSKDYGSESWSDESSSSNSKEEQAQVEKGSNGTYVVTLPEDSSGPVQVSIPNVESNQMIVVVNADGTETVVKKSIVKDGKAVLLLEKNATVRVVDYSSSFTDVAEDAWYNGAVDFVTSRSLFSGVGEDTFAPQEGLNRGMLVTVLYALEEPGKSSVEQSFTDVAQNAWYAPGAAWAVEHGIVSGYGDGLFGPEDSVTREQLAVMLYQYAQYLKLDTKNTASLAQFQDSQAVSSWAREAMAWAVEAGLLSGRSDGTLDPAGSATRAEAAVMIQQFVALMLK